MKRVKKAVLIFIISTLFFTSGLALLFKTLTLDMFSPHLMFIPLVISFLVQKLYLKRPIFGSNGFGFTLGYKRYLLLGPLFVILFVMIVYSISYLLNPDLFSLAQTRISAQQYLATYTENYSLLSNILIAGSIQLLVAPLLNIILYLGEEVGWRSFLYPNLLSIYGKKGLIVGGFIWGIWHAPMIYLYDLNYESSHHLGLVFMIIFCILAGFILQFVFYKSQSVFPVALMHGVLNIAGNFIFIFSVEQEYRYFVDGPTGAVGITILAFIAYLCYQRFPTPQTNLIE